MNICGIIGANIRKIRRGKKLSQDELSYEAGINRGHLSLIENGRVNPTILHLDQIATALGVPIAALLKGYKGN